MQAVAASVDSPRGRNCSGVGRALSLRAVELTCALLLALSSLCAVGLNVAGSAQAATQGEAIVNAAGRDAWQAVLRRRGGLPEPTHGEGGEGCENRQTVGFDCSGLALYAVYQGTGDKIALPHKARGQRSRAVKVEKDVVVPAGQIIRHESELQPGDLVFFGGGSMAKAQHVGIYAGGGAMWDANDNNVPVQLHKLSWEEKGRDGLPFDGGVRYWSADSGPTSPGAGSSGGGGSSGSPSPSGSGEPAPSPLPANLPAGAHRPRPRPRTQRRRGASSTRGLTTQTPAVAKDRRRRPTTPCRSRAR